MTQPSVLVVASRKTLRNDLEASLRKTYLLCLSLILLVVPLSVIFSWGFNITKTYIALTTAGDNGSGTVKERKPSESLVPTDPDQISDLLKATKSLALNFPMFDSVVVTSVVFLHKFLLMEGTGSKVLWGTGAMMVFAYLSLCIVFFYHP